MADVASSRQTWSEALAVYCQRRTAAMFALGFATGLPFLLVYDTLSAWLRQAGLSLSVISFFSLAGLAYAFKFLWAPVVDRTHIPGLTARLGHRRSWMLVVQVAIMAGLCAIALTDPLKHLPMMITFAVLTGFAGATHDIALDAWRIEVAPESAQGAMVAVYQWGYRVAFLVAGAVPLFLADAYSWTVSYFVMAAFMVVGVLGVLFAPREAAHSVRPIPRLDRPSPPIFEILEWILRLCILVLGALLLGSGMIGRDTILVLLLPGAHGLDAAWTARGTGLWLQLLAALVGVTLIVLAACPLPGKRTQPGLFLSQAFGDPLRDFFRRFGRAAGLIVMMICFYRVSDFVLTIMNPFYLDLGFTLTQIAELRKIYGAIMFAVGVFVAGFAIARFGLMRAVIVGSIAAPLSNLTFVWLASHGPSVTGFIVCNGLNIALSYAGVCLIAYMSSLTSAGFTATQYALFSSLYALPDKIIMSQSGRIVEAAAKSADNGGLFAPLKGFLTELPLGTYESGALKTGVAPAALGAGYTAFFIYTCLIGLAVVPVVLAVARRKPS